MATPKTHASLPKFSIIIPCYNEEHYLGNLLGDILSQTTLPSSVVVADCDSTDNTRRVAEVFALSMPLTIVRSTARSAAAARNTAAASLHFPPRDYLVFIDADMRLKPDFLEKLRAAAEQHPADFITPVFVSDGQSRVDTLSIHAVNTKNRHEIRRRHKVAGIGGVMVVRKAMHDIVGGFPEDVNQDDMAYANRLNQAKATAYFASDIQVINSSRRLREEGTLEWLLGVLPEHSKATKVLGRLLRRDLSKRNYGHYTQRT